MIIGPVGEYVIEFMKRCTKDVFLGGLHVRQARRGHRQKLRQWVLDGKIHEKGLFPGKGNRPDFSHEASSKGCKRATKYPQNWKFPRILTIPLLVEVLRENCLNPCIFAVIKVF